MAVTISVWEKNGLKRGNPLTDVGFAQERVLEPGKFTSRAIWESVSYTGGGLLGGNIYQVELRAGTSQGYVRVDATRHQSEWFFVRDGETHEVWLSRI